MTYILVGLVVYLWFVGGLFIAHLHAGPNIKRASTKNMLAFILLWPLTIIFSLFKVLFQKV